MSQYVGRFAPSPTGPLHMGSLICALASYLDARANNGLWLLRMEDIDPPREQAGASDAILHALAAHGLQWDGPVFWQSKQTDRYRDIVETLITAGLAFRCNCSRRVLSASNGIYPGTCRTRDLDSAADHAVRVRVEDDHRVTVNDTIQPVLRQDLAARLGDFVIQRRDGLYAYQLAVVLDDEAQGVTHVLRGADLYDSTPRQMYLQRLLRLRTPGYGHIPVLTNLAGQKFSKQNHAPTLNPADSIKNLQYALNFLNQAACDAADKQTLLQQAICNWQPASISSRTHIPQSELS